MENNKKVHVYIKRIIKINIDTKDPQDAITKAKTNNFLEDIISDTFIVTDENGIILAKEKVNYKGEGVSFTFTG